jgi:hypothetical protein
MQNKLTRDPKIKIKIDYQSVTLLRFAIAPAINLEPTSFEIPTDLVTERSLQFGVSQILRWAIDAFLNNLWYIFFSLRKCHQNSSVV